MDKQIFSLCIAVLCLNYVRSQIMECPNGQEYSSCMRCQGTCEYPTPICPAICRAGCHCSDPTHVIDANGRCVPQSECPTPECPNGQEYSSCRRCQGTCDNPTPMCPAICRAGCQCSNPTHVIDANGRCVPPSDCPTPGCRPDQVWNSCGSPCNPTCQNPYPICILPCVPRCECPPDHVIFNGRCIPRELCPPPCIGGQIWNECGSPCDKTCADPDPACIELCVERCECPDGEVLQNGGCIPLDECEEPEPEDCERWEVWNESGSPCPPPTCADRYPECTLDPEPRCECPPGQVYDDRGRCVDPRRCPNYPCGFGQPIPGRSCGRGSEPCPLGFYCEIDAADRYAVCCPIKGYVKG